MSTPLFYKNISTTPKNQFILKSLLIIIHKLGIPYPTKCLCFYFYHRTSCNSENENEKIKILAALSLSMKINEHVKKFKELVSVVDSVLDESSSDLVALKDQVMALEVALQEQVWFIQDWDAPTRFILGIVKDLGGMGIIYL